MTISTIRPFQSLYVHVPFCHGKCGYCAFYSLGTFAPDSIEKYLTRVENEFSEKNKLCSPLKSIFIGGGTPSVLSAEQLSRLFSAIKKYFSMEENCEWSMEANPESLTIDKIAVAAKYGVNRISLGVQSFNSKIRNFLMRNGKTNSIQKLVKNIREFGLQNLNVDLIYAVPGETVEDWENDLKMACDLGLEHLSAYSLIIEDQTRLARLNPIPPDDALFKKFWHATDKITSEYGLARYEISNFCVKGKKCRHNDDVWHGGTYLGCGPAAVSFNGYDRSANPSDFSSWLKNTSPISDILTDSKRAAEILAFAMRTTSGWKPEDFLEMTGFNAFTLREQEIKRLEELKLLSLSGGRIHPTKRGLLYNDDIIEALL